MYDLAEDAHLLRQGPHDACVSASFGLNKRMQRTRQSVTHFAAAKCARLTAPLMHDVVTPIRLTKIPVDKPQSVAAFDPVKKKWAQNLSRALVTRSDPH